VGGGIRENIDFGELKEEECHSGRLVLYVHEEWGVH
jgi:hypothetical protein